MRARHGAAVLAMVGSLAFGGCSSAHDASPSVAAGSRFLDQFVAGDGRVIRHDQGGDTVSEGQGYAMLLAVRAGDEASFTRVWRWTKANLQRDDGLFSWQWRDGHVADPSPAADADV